MGSAINHTFGLIREVGGRGPVRGDAIALADRAGTNLSDSSKNAHISTSRV